MDLRRAHTRAPCAAAQWRHAKQILSEHMAIIECSALLLLHKSLRTAPILTDAKTTSRIPARNVVGRYDGRYTKALLPGKKRYPTITIMNLINESNRRSSGDLLNL